VQRIGDGQAQVGYSMAERSRGQVTLCVICTVQRRQEHKFLGLASKLRLTVSPGLTSKPVATVLVVCPQNHLLRFSGLGLKTGNCGLVIWPLKSLWWFLGLGLKTKWEEVYRFVPQNRWEDEDGVRTRVDIRQLALVRSKSGQGFPVFP
jgi:hypothetical protein